MPKKSDLTGKRFGRLVAVRDIGTTGGAYVWECFCDCGNTAYVRGAKLSNGHTKSCGCLRREETAKRSCSHRFSKTRLYRIWCNIKTRCTNQNAHNYKFYGGKGVSICEEWKHDFLAFYNWAMANGYEHGLTIDRRDSEGNYCPANCRWITQSENATRANNKRWAVLSTVRTCKK